ncbi:MAG: RluA family pseudouridine synthase [Actinomycetota bacterium]
MTRVDFVAGVATTGERVDAAVARRLGVARTAVQRALREGSLTVDGEEVRPSHRLGAGQRVVGVVEVPGEQAPKPEDIPIAVRYSDDRVLVVSKPAGLVTHPASGHGSGTLVNALLATGVPLAGLGSPRPGIVHRLDKDTSGLLLVAKDDAAHAFLVAALKDRSIERTYVALVRGRPPAASGSIDAPIGRHPARRWLMAVVPEGRPAVTNYRILASAERYTLLEVGLETGRTHQIRVHLAHLGSPVLGDRTYGGASELSRELGLTRAFLHASRLVFPHPDDSRSVEVSDELPEDLASALARAGLPPPPSAH